MSGGLAVVKDTSDFEIIITRTMASTCRICMETTEDTLPMATMKADDEIEILKLGIMFEDCFGIEISEIPDYTKICMGCKIQLTYYCDFKKLALKTHGELQKLSKFRESTFKQKAEPEAEEIQDDVVIVNGVLDEYGYSPSEENIEYLEEDIQQLDATDFNDDEISQIAGELDLYKSEPVDDTVRDDGQTISDHELLLEYYETNNEVDESDVCTDTERYDQSESSKNVRWKFHCKICGKKFRSIDIYNGHLNVHQGLPAYSCTICRRNFKHKVNFDYHMKNHENKRSYKCSVANCGKTCLSGWDLKIHMRTHTDLRPYSCEICGRSFRVKSHVTDHMETHTNSKSYECSTCLQKYKTKASLKMHVTTIHLKQNQYACTVCGKVFYRNHHLKVHQKVHERNLKI